MLQVNPDSVAAAGIENHLLTGESEVKILAADGFDVGVHIVPVSIIRMNQQALNAHGEVFDFLIVLYCELFD